MILPLALLAAHAMSQESTVEPRLMRLPSIHGDTIVFTYAGDLWVTHLQGGIARRLTSSPGFETYPQISPDGKTVAFTGQYDGSTNIYTIPIEGGQPKRLTYGTSDICLGWTPDGSRIAYDAPDGAVNGRQRRLWYVDPAGGLPQATKIYEIGSLSFFPDGKTIAYNRQISFNFNWRHYRGGSEGKISFYNFPDNKYWELPSHREQSDFPMVVGRYVYYTSDRTHGVFNLWRYDMNTKQDRQLTNYADADVRTPSTDGKTIVFEQDGLLYAYDIATGQAHHVETRIYSEDLLARPYLRNVASDITSLDISPTGVRLVLEARGNLFSVPAKHGDTRNMTELSGARARYPSWSPDGKTIAYATDQTGNYEIYTMPQLGGKPTQLTSDTQGTIEGLSWSPTGKYILFQKSDHTVWFLDVATKKLTKVVGDEEIHSVDWSPDERWIAYVGGGGTSLARLYLYEVATGKTSAVDNGQFEDDTAAFDQNGKYLYLVSSRTFNPTYGQFEFSLKIENSQRVYVIPLAKDSPDPLEVADEEEPTQATGAPPAKTAKPEPSKPETKVDLDGIESRIVPLPMPAGAYSIPFAGKDAVFYTSGGVLYEFDWESRTPEPILVGALGSLATNPSRTKIAYELAGVVGVVDVHPGNKAGDGKVDTSGMEEIIDPRKEWRQMYWEAWRHERDYFYDPTMRGLNWKAIGDHYAEYLRWVNDRNDLNYVIGLLIGQLGTSHSYVFGGDMGPTPKPIPIGLLGADYEAEGNNLRFSKIFRGHNYSESDRGPLAEPGVVVHEGDYLLAIDDKPVDAHTNPAALLLDKVNRYVTLTVNSTPSLTGARKIRVKPIANETDIRYDAFVDAEAKYVGEISHGKIGYMHIRDTAAMGARDFVAGFYSQTGKDALVVDERWNSGGYVQPWFVDTLGRKMYAYAKPRDLPPQPIEPAIVGPKAMLINGYAGSGGDFFPYMFRFAKLGPLVGERTWGGLVGINENPVLVDGGVVTAPAFAIFDPENGEIIAENHGIDPDIVVDDRPDLVAEGKDPQLEAAVKYLMEELQKHPPKPIPQGTPKVSPLGRTGEP